MGKWDTVNDFCPCNPKTDGCYRSFKTNNEWFEKIELLREIRDRESKLWLEAKTMLECTEQEIKALRIHGWITSQPGADANCFCFATEFEWAWKVRELEELASSLREERDRHFLRKEIADRQLYNMSLGHPGHEGVSFNV